MAKTIDNAPDFCRSGWKYWIGRNAEGAPLGWMDDMIMRLLEYANVQLIQLEDTTNLQHERDEQKYREVNSRIFSRLSRDIIKLVQYESARAALRGFKAAERNEGALEKLISHIDRLAEARGTDSPSQDAE